MARPDDESTESEETLGPAGDEPEQPEPALPEGH
jgi:hypothetical protein